MRHIMVLMHRWVGLAIAAFVFIAGLTGAVIAWDHELDAWLNPHLFKVTSIGPSKSAFDLAALVEARDPRVRISYLALSREPGASQEMSVRPRRNPATGRPFEPGYDEIYLDPATGTELGRRESGQVWPITRETIIAFLYKLHFSLHLPEIWGIDRWGVWLMGAVAVLWTVDCFVGFYLTLPIRRSANPRRPPAVAERLSRGWWSRWKPAWKIKRLGSAYRITFDLHRAFSLWTWGLLFALAFTGFSLNLNEEVFRPFISSISQVTPDPFDGLTEADERRSDEQTLDRAQLVGQARAEGLRRGWREPVGGLSYYKKYDVYVVRFFELDNYYGLAGAGPAILVYDGKDGGLLTGRPSWVGTAADIFVKAQFPVHSGRILGLTGRVLISFMGVVVAMLSVTGVVIWWRKRAARLSIQRKKTAPLGVTIPAE